jgi:hypothetical protein
LGKTNISGKEKSKLDAAIIFEASLIFCVFLVFFAYSNQQYCR